MSKRRQWKESLKNDCTISSSDDEKPIVIHAKKKKKENKKNTITIISQKTFRNIDGKLVEIPIAKEPEISERAITPRQLWKIENITPTYRDPENFLEETKIVLDKISPPQTATVISDQNESINLYELSDSNKTFIKGSPEAQNERKPRKKLNFSTDATSLKKEDKHRTDDAILDNFIDDLEDSYKHKNDKFQVKVEIEHVPSRQSADVQDDRNRIFEKVEVEHNITEDIEYINDNAENNDRFGNNINSTEKNINMEEHKPNNKAFGISTLEEEKKLEQEVNKITSKRKAFHKNYLDFEDDLDQILLNEAFPSDVSTEWISSDTESSFGSFDANAKTKNRKRHSKKKNGKKKNKKTDQPSNETITSHSIEKKKLKKEVKKENEHNRSKGEAYVNAKGEHIAAKSMKPNPCIGKNCGNDCGSIPEEKRESLFKYFWDLNNHQRRKDWISQCAIRKTVKNTNKCTLQKRNCSYDYYINEGLGRRKVCQKYILSTLDITQRFVLYTLVTMTDGFAKADARGKCGGYNKTREDIINNAKNFVMSLPLMPSHYCRKDSSRVYLPQDFKNISNLYKIYVHHCTENQYDKIMSFKVFSVWFKKTFNIGFHVPKKDKCMTCINNTDDKTEEEKNKIAKHIEEKEESYKRFKFHQELHKKDKTTLCASFDMQKVLNTPHGKNMRLYYSRKLSVHNFTIYESVTREGYCYVWTEVDARRGANEISTCFLDYIKNVDARGPIKTLLLYCDSCYGQNKNKTVLALLRCALSECKNLNTIQINYLIPGHTFMPVDSIHATIENAIKKSTVWAPSQWPTIFQFARQNPTPYKVNILKGQDFLGFNTILDMTFKKKTKLMISKVRIVTFSKNKPNTMFVKYSMLQNEATEVSIETLSEEFSVKTNLYPSGLPISVKKIKNLKTLVDKKIIPSVYTQEYLNLKSSTKVKDCLEETDEEDDDVQESQEE